MIVTLACEGYILVACIYLFIGFYVCMLPTFLKNYWTELHEIFRDDLSSFKDQSVRFWERSGQRSRSRSRKVKNYGTELHEIFRDDLSSSKDQLITFWERSGQRSRSRSRKGKKRICVITLNFCPIHMKPTSEWSLFNSLSSDMVTDVELAKVCALPNALLVL